MERVKHGTKRMPVYVLYINNNKKSKMSLIRIILAVVFPPLAVADKGLGNFLIVFLLWLCGHLPGTIAALIILYNKNERKQFAVA
jgi:uncharacterized membrane protein YqaE (UPF0057 family)